MIRKIVQNQVKCLKCGDEPFSKHVHDFKYCKCGAVAVDGGMEYLRRIGDLTAVEEMSMSMNVADIESCITALVWARDSGRNDFGAVLAVLRSLRKSGLLDMRKLK